MEIKGLTHFLWQHKHAANRKCKSQPKQQSRRARSNRPKISQHHHGTHHPNIRVYPLPQSSELELESETGKGGVVVTHDWEKLAVEVEAERPLNIKLF